MPVLKEIVDAQIVAASQMTIYLLYVEHFLESEFIRNVAKILV